MSIFSPSSTCMVYPRAPEVRGMMVILVTGAEWDWRAATRAWPTSWWETICFSWGEMTAFFRWAPAMTVSTLSSKSAWVTVFRPRRTARRAPSLTMLASSAPEAPAVARAMALQSTSPSI